MDNGSWVAAFVPLPFVLLILGVVAAVVFFGLLFAFNQIIGLIISGAIAHVQARRTATREVSTTDEEAVEASGAPVSGEGRLARRGL